MIKQYCKRGHNTFATGRYNTRACIQCYKDIAQTPEGKEKIRIKNKKQALLIRNCNLKHNYGIDLAKYNEYFEAQKGLCFGCKTHQSQLKEALHVDHNHITGRVRGLLCTRCNTILGMAKDNPRILERLSYYLEQLDGNNSTQPSLILGECLRT